MSILNNVTKQPPDHIKNTMGEIRLKIDAWIIPTPYIVALDCIFTIVVQSTLKIGAECIYICTNSQNYQIDIMVEFTLKNGSWTYITHLILNTCKGITQIGG
jgi:hypothetical protein